MFGTKEASVSPFFGMGCCSVCGPCLVLKRKVDHRCVRYERGKWITIVFCTKEASGSPLCSILKRQVDHHCVRY